MGPRIPSQLLRSVALVVLTSAMFGCSLPSSGVELAVSQARFASRYSGYLYVGKNTYSRSEILVYAPSSLKKVQTITAGILGGIAGTRALGFDASGNLYLATVNPNEVVVYQPGRTKPSYTITHGLDDPFALNFDSAGDLFVLNCPNCVLPNHRTSQQGSVSVYAPGKMLPSYAITAGIHNPLASAVDSSGNLYVANCPSHAAPHTCTANYYNKPGGGTVTVYRPGKSTPAYTITNGIDAPTAVAIDASDNFYVANVGDDEVAVYKPGTAVPAYDILLGIVDGVYPGSMAFDRNGNLYVATCSFGETGRICAYPPGSGTPLAYFQTPLNYSPRILAVDGSGTLFALEVGFDGIKSAPNHQGQVAIAVYPPGAGRPSRVISTGTNYEAAMALSP